MRQTLALQARLAAADRARTETGRALSSSWFQSEGGVESARERLHRKLAAAMGDAADDEPADREDLLADLHERLDDEDGAGRSGGPPVGEAIGRIGRDLDRFSSADDEKPPSAPGLDPWPSPAAGGEPSGPRPATSSRVVMPP